jgi:Putative glycosyl/glycerophosphate transferases involved in teichoic acid biosynthesis TagF/TagB/EpsJ/RodC
VNPFKKIIEKYRRLPKLAKYRYTAYYEKLPVSEDTILIECFNGDGITGNPFWLLKAICGDKRLARYKLYVAANQKHYSEVCRALKVHGLDRATALAKYDKLYLKLLASAKYLITDVSLPIFFIKKPGQILLNVWHGTPLKGLGRSIRDNPHAIGNVQRIFLMSDYLLYPNRFTFDRMREDYMIAPYFKGKYVLSGYPRNDILFDREAAQKVREKLGLEGRRVVVYMPTYRDCADEEEKTYHDRMLRGALNAIEYSAPGDITVIAKLHHLSGGSIDFTGFKRVIPFPDEYETYEVLAAADCLVTDYSSVMFDFAGTGRKIVLYAYDSQRYRDTRSMYFPLERLPFPIVTQPDSLAKEVGLPAYEPYADAMKEFTRYDCPDSSEKLVNLLFFGRTSKGMEIIDGSVFHNGNPNILIYAGTLIKNGMTTALMGILENTDTSKYNYLLTFYQKLVGDTKDVLNRLGRDVGYLGMPEGKPITYYEAICQYLYFHFNVDLGFTRSAVRKISERDALRCFCGIDFHSAIHYTGYEKNVIHLFNAMNTRKIIYVHNDMLRETSSKGNIHRLSIMTAYREFDRIAAVRESMRSEISGYIAADSVDRIAVAHNLNNIGYIRNRASEPLAFDADTWCNVSLDRVKEILALPEAARFIDIARFSPEKGLDRLVDAFVRCNREHPETYLFVIGGYGAAFDALREQIEDCGCDHIVLIKSIRNPYPILAKCEAFILSSRYEGLPMTIMEALILGKPVVSTDIPGPAEFLRESGCGLLVEDSTEGVLDGFNAYYDGRLRSLKPFDAEAFNRKALAEFYGLLQ